MITWTWRSFSELTNQQLYDLLALRVEVFMIEQKCFYQDLDYEDQHAQHLLGIDNEKIVAYLRLFLPGTLYPDKTCFGRVVVATDERGKQLSKELLRETLLYLHNKNITTPIKISAQIYLEKFYQSYGFETISKPYDDHGVVHVDMIRPGKHEQT